MEEALNTAIHVINFAYQIKLTIHGGGMEEALNTAIHVINFVISN